jgi:protein-S-isoprenylcysteine O-methyltransferase Ste14
VAIHLVNTFHWRRATLPWYDAWVGYLGALAWFVLVIASRGIGHDVPLAASIVGLPVVVVGLYVHGSGIRDITRFRDEGSLVTRGIYTRLRHPIYYGWVLVSFGMPMLLGSWLGLVTAPLWAGAILVVAVLEERDMARMLPEGVYEDYRRDTLL